MIESWMVNIGIVVVTGIGTYAVLKSRVERLEKDLAHHNKDDGIFHSELERKLTAQFKRVDECSKRITILERDTQTHLTMPKAEEKFVSKIELELHLKNIELQQNNINDKLGKVEGNLEELLNIFRDKNNG